MVDYELEISIKQFCFTLTIDNRTDSEQCSQSENGICDRLLVDLFGFQVFNVFFRPIKNLQNNFL